jgi:CBS domain-containing protein
MKTGIPVADICHRTPMTAFVVTHDTPLREVIDRLTDQYHAIPIFVTDTTERLHGIVHHDDLRDWVRLQCNLMPISGRVSVGKTRRLLSAQTIGELAQHEGSLMSVRLDESLTDAMTKMSAYGRNHIAVVDGNGRFVNTLNLQDILSFMLDKERKIQA